MAYRPHLPVSRAVKLAPPVAPGYRAAGCGPGSARSTAASWRQQSGGMRGWLCLAALPGPEIAALCYESSQISLHKASIISRGLRLATAAVLRRPCGEDG